MSILVYLLPMIMIWLGFIWYQKSRSVKAQATLDDAKSSGLDQPASLHPIIDPVKCLGCGSCVSACPEGKIIGIINGKAKLIEASHCIGHGQCKDACPVDAISLVFGTAKRGVDLPELDGNFETNINNIFIAGELGGMGLIKNATEQGIQAMQYIAKRITTQRGNASNTPSDTTKNAEPSGGEQTLHDVVIIGAGPAGIAASLTAKQLGLDFVCLEQDSLGGTVAHFPRNKIVMTAPVNLPLVGKIKLKEVSKEALLEMWQGIIEKTQLKLNFGERLEKITPLKSTFTVHSSKQTYTTKAVLLCLGRRGTPRKLNVQGEEQSKVVYRLIDARQYQGHHVLIVGGGDSALEAAIAVAEEADTQVTLSYRGDGFNRAKLKNRQAIEAHANTGRLKVLLQSQIERIDTTTVTINTVNGQQTIANDAVIICAGGVLPTPMLQAMGINIETKHGSL